MTRPTIFWALIFWRSVGMPMAWVRISVVRTRPFFNSNGALVAVFIRLLGRVFEPIGNDILPGLFGAPQLLFGFGRLGERLLGKPPGFALVVGVDGFGPELLAVGGEGRDIDGGALDGPEAAAAGAVAQIFTGVRVPTNTVCRGKVLDWRP